MEYSTYLIASIRSLLVDLRVWTLPVDTNNKDLFYLISSTNPFELNSKRSIFYYFILFNY